MCRHTDRSSPAKAFSERRELQLDAIGLGRLHHSHRPSIELSAPLRQQPRHSQRSDRAYQANDWAVDGAASGSADRPGLKSMKRSKNTVSACWRPLWRWCCWQDRWALFASLAQTTRDFGRADEAQERAMLSLKAQSLLEAINPAHRTHGGAQGGRRHGELASRIDRAGTHQRPDAGHAAGAGASACTACRLRCGEAQMDFPKLC